ncbi:MAG: NAD(P)H-hydrate dehydratase [Candidatus Palauibacterales bacterium]|nr:NAD(P)H-hydrate dehydratase [Candidatus Palauibacterales bacterium]
MPDERGTIVQSEAEAWTLGAQTVWLPSAAEMAALDREAVVRGATTERTLIEVAGREVARRVQERWPAGRVVAIAGRGHNGADALVALRTLRAWGREVTAVLASDTMPDPDVLVGWDIAARGPAELDRSCVGASVILDGILGTGVTGAPREPQATLIDRLNAMDLPVVAVDGPSGANFTSGAVAGACVRADVTVSLGWPNLGLLMYPARACCGRIECVEIGFPPPRSPFGARAITGRWVGETLIPRLPDSHKGRAGYLTLIAGQSGMAGASVLGARAALRGGVGILKVLGDPANREILQKACPGAIFASWGDESERRDAIEWANALAIGPGLGRGGGRRELVEEALRSRGSRPVVLDADGLSVFEGRFHELAELLGPADVVTPHPGELARLRETTVEDISADPPTAARSAAQDLGCTVLLKGSPSLVAEAGRPLRVSTTGGPEVASGGTGDVLTGLTGAYLAAGMSAADAVSAALFLTGVAASRSVEPAGHLAGDIPDRLPDVRAEVQGLGPLSGPVIFASGDGA